MFNFCMKSSFHVCRDSAENARRANLKITCKYRGLTFIFYTLLFARACHLKHISLPVLHLKICPGEN